MGKRRLERLSPAHFVPARENIGVRNYRSRLSLPFLASFGAITLILSPMIDPTASEAMAFEVPSAIYEDDGQTLAANDAKEKQPERALWDVIKLKPKPKPKPAPVVEAAAVVAAAPSAGAVSPGSAQAIAREMVAARGWGSEQFDCLVSLWNRESGWNVTAANPSGAYGIPQALPGNKMATVGADWRTSARTQITWGLGYIQGRYTNPCGAWASSEARGWY